MRQLCLVVRIILVLFLSSRAVLAQSTASDAVPRVIKITGVFRPADGQPPPASKPSPLSIYADERAGRPLWQETQSVAVDDAAVTCWSSAPPTPTASRPPSSPPAPSGSAPLRATRRSRRGRACRLTSVPYALRAAEADTLGGHPASDYALATAVPAPRRPRRRQHPDLTSRLPQASSPAPPTSSPSTSDTADVGNSALFEKRRHVGLGTTAPLDSLHVKFTNTNGASDRAGGPEPRQHRHVLLRHALLRPERRARPVPGLQQRHPRIPHQQHRQNGASQFDGSINFMIGSTLPLLRRATTATSASARRRRRRMLEVSNALIASRVCNAPR